MPALGHIYGEGWKGNGELCSPTIINPLNEHNQPRHPAHPISHSRLIIPSHSIIPTLDNLEINHAKKIMSVLQNAISNQKWLKGKASKTP